MTALALTAMLCAGSDPSPAATPSRPARAAAATEEDSIRSALRAFTDAVSQEDYDAVLGMITDDAVFWTADAPAIQGKAALKAAYAGLAPYRVHQDFEVEELQVCGDWAFVRGYESFTLDPKDGKGARLEIKRRRAISILRRQPDGSWKTARGMTNYDAPRPAAGSP
jgi:uncharacterized protein (TIGR02246 family)